VNLFTRMKSPTAASDHRARRDLERLDQERAQQEHDQDHRKKLTDTRSTTLLGPAHATRSHALQRQTLRSRPAGSGGQREAQRSLRCSTARNASWGFRPSRLFSCVSPFLLLFQQLALRVTSRVALGEHVLAQRLHVLPRDNVAPIAACTRRRTSAAESARAAESPGRGRQLRGFAVDHARERVDALAVHQDVEPHHVGRAVFLELVVERAVARVIDFSRSKKSSTTSLSGSRTRSPRGRRIMHVGLRAALLRAQRDHRPTYSCGTKSCSDHRLADFLDQSRSAGAPGSTPARPAVAQLHLVDHDGAW